MFNDPWILNLGIANCSVTDLRNSSFCSSPERVGLISSLGCMDPILKGYVQSTGSQGFICAAISGLEVCTDNFIQMLGENHCTPADVKSGLQSATSKQWLHLHYPSLTLDECFTVYQPGAVSQDAECRDFVYISKHTQQAMGVMYLTSASVVGQAAYCQTFYYTLHLLQHEMDKLGHTCSIKDLQHTFTTILGYQGKNKTVLTACTGQFLSSPADFCHDKKMVLSVLANDPYCKPYINNIISSKSDADTCMFLKQFDACAETKLHYAGFDCDTKSMFSAGNLQQYFSSSNTSVTLPDCSVVSRPAMIG